MKTQALSAQDQPLPNTRTAATAPHVNVRGRARVLFAVVAALLGVAPLATAQSIFDGSYEGLWTDAWNWSAGVPDPSIDAQIRNTQTVLLPSAIGSAATARSLSIFATDQDGSGAYRDQSVRLYNGTLNLTPSAIESLSVGIASPLLKTRYTQLDLHAVTLTSTGIAKIGVGLPAGAGGALDGVMNLISGTQWLHASGLIEVGGWPGIGKLTIHDSSLLAGSLFPGIGLDPRVVVNSGSSLDINRGGAARLSEVSVNSTTHFLGSSGLEVEGSLDSSRLTVGEISTGTVFLLQGSVSRLGEVSVNRNSTLTLYGATSQANSIVVGDGRIVGIGELERDGLEVRIPSQLTIGTPGSLDTLARPLILADESGTTANLKVANSNVTVHGDAALGQFGNATVELTAGGVLDIRGKATLGESNSSFAGSGHASVTGVGAVLRAQNLEVGYSYFDTYSHNPYPSPTGSVTVGNGGRLEIAGFTYSFIRTLGGSSWTVDEHHAGHLTIGKHGTLDILDDSGKVVFTDPSAGGTLDSEARLINYGTIKGGGTDAAGDPSIDFGDRGGTLENYGTIDVGHSPGWLSVFGDVEFRSGGRLLIELGGTNAGLDYDVFEIWGNADFSGGTLELSFINGYTPLAGDCWDFLRVSGSITGWFSSFVVTEGYESYLTALQGWNGESNFRLYAEDSSGGGGSGSSVPEGGATGLLLTASLFGLILLKRRSVVFAATEHSP